MTESRARYGWESDFPDFQATPPSRICERLSEFVTYASAEQRRAWADSIPPLQREVEEVMVRDELAAQYSAILEYELPMESRRPAHGDTAFTVPMFDEFMRRAIPHWKQVITTKTPAKKKRS